MPENENFTFQISLSVLDHLGRNLYRSFVTVLGEAISNAWDADAKNVWIYIDKTNNNFVIKDDGIGMTSDDFQKKFLKIGYSKRGNGDTKSSAGRPFIGRKGIGKLALLSCADKIEVFSKTKDSDYIGGTIDNSGLTEAITEDLTPQEYKLGSCDQNKFTSYTEGHDHGTIIFFENFNDGIKNTVEYLKKMIALYFRFSLLDDSFNIYLDNEKIDINFLDDLAGKTEFLWNINEHNDPFINEKLTNLKESDDIKLENSITGFIGSVEKPRNLKIMSTGGEKIGIDLFVNGRLREKDILKYMPTARLVESYLYGQVHYNELDDEEDRFTSNREGVVADDPKYNEFLNTIKRSVMNKILEDWDNWRRKHKEDGDSENESIPLKDRKSEELFNAVSSEYSLPDNSEEKKKVDGWVNELSEDARYNFGSYAECFVSENLVRKYIQENKIALSTEADTESKKWQSVEQDNKNKGNISIDIRKNNTTLSYLSMDHLAAMVDKKDPIKEACLLRDAKEYKPMRDALSHTALLTDVGKNKLSSVYENIKGRIRDLLSNK